MNATEVYEYLSLGPDAFSRFFICKEILKKTFNQKPIKLLDVGGNSKYFYQSLELDKLPYELSVIDILPPSLKDSHNHYIQGDATKMELADNSFDAVVSMDVLEHIRDSKKTSFLRECYRVAKDLVVIAAPFDTSEHDQAEKMANDYYRHLHGQDHPWLLEHFQQNKPKKLTVESELKSFGSPYIRFESNHLPLWLKMILLNFTPDNLASFAKVQKLNHWYNKNLLRLGDFNPPGYRWFYVIYKNPDLVKKFNQYFELEYSTSGQLSLEQKFTELFTEELTTSFYREENARLEREISLKRARINNLGAVLDTIGRSKSYRLLCLPGTLRQKTRRRV